MLVLGVGGRISDAEGLGPGNLVRRCVQHRTPSRVQEMCLGVRGFQ